MIEKNIKLLEWYYNSGVTDIMSNSSRAYLKNNLKDECADVQSDVVQAPVRSKNMSSREFADSCPTLSELKRTVQNFEGCDLKKTARNTVFSDGNENAAVMLMGEAPGANEDAKGIPFCGDSGQLLDKVLASIGLVRKDNIYITNVMFWRPPANRKPTDEELKLCLPFVEKHIALMSPKLLIVAGGVALSSLFGIASGISRYRQKLLQYNNQYMKAPVPVIVIFHPSYLMRQPMQKKLAWQDMLFIKNFLGDK